MKLKVYSIAALLFAFCVIGFAQVTYKTTDVKQMQPTKPPVVKTSLGKVAVTSATPDIARSILAMPLTVVDNNNVSYPVESYQFLYKKKSIVEDEKTGRKAITFTQVADLFKVVPLPQLWVNNVGGGLQRDEELYFFDIVVKDDKGRKFFAPDLRIKIQ
jgi:hypothetical protein